MSLSRSLRHLTVFTVGLAGIAIASLSGCGGGSGSNNNGNNGNNGGGTTLIAPGTTPFTNSRQSSAAACQANAHQSGHARWTVLVYMNAANNLQPDSLTNVAQLAATGSDGANLNIVLQWKQAVSCNFFSSVNACGTTSFVGTHRYYIRQHSAADVSAIQNGDTSSLEDSAERLPDPATNTLTDNGNTTSDMGDYHALNNFVSWGEQNYPADHIAVVVWDHGSGPLTVDNRSVMHGPTGINLQKLGPTATPSNRSVKSKTTPPANVTARARQNGKPGATRGVSQDANTGNQITTPQLATALTGLPQAVDALIIDCSLQCGIEVNYEVRNVARILVGSEESPPGAGYPYDTWLTDLKANGQNPCAVGNELLQDTLNEYASSGFTNITQAMVDLSQMSNVATAFNALGGSLLSHVSDQQNLIYTERQNAQYYDFPELKDLYDFSDLLRTATGSPSDLQTAAYNLEYALTNTTNGAILAFVHGAQGQAGSQGMYVYLPGPQEQSSVDSAVGFDSQYNQLAIATAAPNWVSFLQAQNQ